MLLEHREVSDSRRYDGRKQPDVGKRGLGRDSCGQSLTLAWIGGQERGNVHLAGQEMHAILIHNRCAGRTLVQNTRDLHQIGETAVMPTSW